jgi:hypothetical protein
MVRRLCYLLLLSLFVASNASATWEKIIQSDVTAFDMQSNGTGLIAISQTAPYLAKKTPTSLDGVIAMTSPITDVSIVDQNTAFMVVKDSGVYQGSKGWLEWSRIDTITTMKFLITTPWAIVGQSSKGTRFLYQGKFYFASGLDFSDPLLGIDYLSDSTLIGVTAFKIYRSTNFGRDWKEIHEFPEAVNGSIYIDRSRNTIYVGGNYLQYSMDGGSKWTQIMKTGNGDNTSGYVYGTPDCTGTFYIVSYGVAREILISRTQGDFFQLVGFNPGGVTSAPKKLQVFNRGNNLYWLEPIGPSFTDKGALYYSGDGADGSAVDSATFFMSLKVQQNNLFRICREQSKVINVDFSNIDCIPIIVDSIRQQSGHGQLFADLGAFTVTDKGVNTRTLTYHNNKVILGWDTVRMVAYVHSAEGVRQESIEFTVVVRTLSDPAEMTTSVSDISFGEVKLEAEKSLPFSITNTGCDLLRLDSIRSSYPEIFTIVSSKSFPITLAKNAKADFSVKFKPIEEGPFLEALEIGSNGGHEFISLYGVGAKTPTISVDRDADAPSVRFYPNPFIGSVVIENVPLSSAITVLDIHGREVLSLTSTEARVVLSLDDAPSGTYILAVGSRRYKLFKE